MMIQRFLCSSALTMALFVAAGAVRADEPDEAALTEAGFPAFARGEAKSFAVRRVEGGETLPLRDDPVLAWTNPVSGSVHGRLYIWTDKGRPEVVVGIYKWFSPFTHRTSEFKSLSLGPLAVERKGEPYWMPARPGVELKPVPDAPAPAASPAQRLRQMRAMAQDFKAKETTRAGLDRELRVLTQPLYRYESTDPNLVDGALFGIALGTDPEAFLLLEARRTGQSLQWQYAMARMNSIQMRGSYRGREVWSVETLPWDMTHNPHEPYATFITGKIVAP